jgi:hypothetical protein
MDREEILRNWLLGGLIGAYLIWKVTRPVPQRWKVPVGRAGFLWLTLGGPVGAVLSAQTTMNPVLVGIGSLCVPVLFIGLSYGHWRTALWIRERSGSLPSRGRSHSPDDGP